MQGQPRLHTLNIMQRLIIPRGGVCLDVVVLVQVQVQGKFVSKKVLMDQEPIVG